MPEGNDFHADVPDYYLPPKEDVYTSMESLIYHFKIVMGEIPIPVAEIYHPVEGGNELGFYLVTDGSRTHIDCILEDLVLFTIKPIRNDKRSIAF
jgi:NADH-quinone oxidoreductase subunit D